jgi:hypothetical protein
MATSLPSVPCEGGAFGAKTLSAEVKAAKSPSAVVGVGANGFWVWGDRREDSAHEDEVADSSPPPDLEPEALRPWVAAGRVRELKSPDAEFAMLARMLESSSSGCCCLGLDLSLMMSAVSVGGGEDARRRRRALLKKLRLGLARGNDRKRIRPKVAEFRREQPGNSDLWG